MSLVRRWVLGLVLSLALPAAALAGPAPVTASDHILGRADAPVTVIEYASVTCPHCAAWHREVFPAFKARFIDTGRVRFVYREFLTAPGDLSFAGALLARCAPAELYFDVIGALMAGQSAMYAGEDPVPWLRAGAGAGGLDGEAASACLRDEGGAAALDRRIAEADAAGVRSSPSFFVNGAPFDGWSAADFEAAITAARPAN